MNLAHALEDLEHVVSDLLHRDGLILSFVDLNYILQVRGAVLEHHVLHGLLILSLAVVNIEKTDHIFAVLEFVEHLKFATNEFSRLHGALDSNSLACIAIDGLEDKAEGALTKNSFGLKINVALATRLYIVIGSMIFFN